MAYIMVLNDGETYSDLAGCMIVKVSDALANDPDELEAELHDLRRADYPFDYITDNMVLVEVYDSEPRWGETLWEADCGV